MASFKAPTIHQDFVSEEAAQSIKKSQVKLYAYRNGVFAPRPVGKMGPSVLRSIAGVAGYYVPKFPYVTWKYLREK
jgi:hypothetical protein